MIHAPMQTLHDAALIEVLIKQFTKAPTDDLPSVSHVVRIHHSVLKITYLMQSLKKKNVTHTSISRHIYFICTCMWHLDLSFTACSSKMTYCRQSLSRNMITTSHLIWDICIYNIYTYQNDWLFKSIDKIEVSLLYVWKKIRIFF